MKSISCKQSTLLAMILWCFIATGLHFQMSTTMVNAAPLNRDKIRQAPPVLAVSNTAPNVQQQQQQLPALPSNTQPSTTTTTTSITNSDEYNNALPILSPNVVSPLSTTLNTDSALVSTSSGGTYTNANNNNAATTVTTPTSSNNGTILKQEYQGCRVTVYNTQGRIMTMSNTTDTYTGNFTNNCWKRTDFPNYFDVLNINDCLKVVNTTAIVPPNHSAAFERKATDFSHVDVIIQNVTVPPGAYIPDNIGTVALRWSNPALNYPHFSMALFLPSTGEGINLWYNERDLNEGECASGPDAYGVKVVKVCRVSDSGDYHELEVTFL